MNRLQRRAECADRGIREQVFRDVGQLGRYDIALANAQAGEASRKT
jgi:hypothetical protein